MGAPPAPLTLHPPLRPRLPHHRRQQLPAKAPLHLRAAPPPQGLRTLLPRHPHGGPPRRHLLGRPGHRPALPPRGRALARGLRPCTPSVRRFDLCQRHPLRAGWPPSCHARAVGEFTGAVISGGESMMTRTGRRGIIGSCSGSVEVRCCSSAWSMRRGLCTACSVGCLTKGSGR
ncbi:hypothetical protein DAI22_11g227400 [Oryza sativa Japonica Group]|nr:hypothetical protein DAI22_11g227400 [Oryza sativa Japonica Group]